MVCHLCELPIPTDVDTQRHPLRFSVDELIPYGLGGSTTDPANLRPAHAVCNSSRQQQPITPEVKHRCRTLARTHMPGPTINEW